MAYKKCGSTKATSLDISRNIEQWILSTDVAVC